MEETRNKHKIHGGTLAKCPNAQNAVNFPGVSIITNISYNYTLEKQQIQWQLPQRDDKPAKKKNAARRLFFPAVKPSLKIV